MNKIFKVIWSKVRKCYVVVSEYGRSSQKKSTSIQQLAALNFRLSTRFCRVAVATFTFLACNTPFFGGEQTALAASMPSTYKEDGVTYQYNHASGLMGIYYNTDKKGYALVTYSDNTYATVAYSKTGTYSGEKNVASGDGSFASAGRLNIASGSWSSVSGGASNTASGGWSSISGGEKNTANALSSSISGGESNTASGHHSSVFGGAHNTASGYWSSVFGGDYNTASNNYSSVFGGTRNTASGLQSSVSGGFINTASGDTSSVSGGQENTASGLYSSVFGGVQNTASANYSSAFGGQYSVVHGQYSVGIAGGSTGANAKYSLAAGYQSVVTVANGTAVGYQSTANKDGTIAFGHDSGDVSGYTVTWQQRTDKDSGGNIVKNPDNTTNDYTKAPTITENKYTSAYYNRLVKVADGQSSHDVATVGQTIELTSGNGISIVADGTNDIGQKKYKIMATVSAGGSGIDYDDSTKASVTFAGTNGTRLTNLMDARLTESSTDAVTGRQLYATNQSIAGFAKDIANNTSTIATLRKAVTSTQSSVTAVGTSVDSMDALKADASLGNLSDAGKQVIVNAANDAVQAYMKNLKSGTASSTTAATAKTATTTVSTNSLLSTSLLTKKAPVNLTASLMAADAGDVETSKLKDEMQTIKTDVKDLQSKTIQYDSTDGSRVTLKGKDGSTLANVKAGKVEAGSKEAVNGDQLYEEQVERKKADTAILASVGDLGERNAINEAHLDQLDQDVTRLGNQVNRLDTKIDKVGAGAAALAALHPQDFDPEDKLSFAAGVGNYRGTQATALGAFYRPDDRTTFSLAGAFGNGENMMNMGISLKLGKGSPYSGMDKHQLIQVVNRQGAVIDGQEQEIQALKAQMASMQKAIAELKAR